jgi:hypothetical protein
MHADFRDSNALCRPRSRSRLVGGWRLGAAGVLCWVTLGCDPSLWGSSISAGDPPPEQTEVAGAEVTAAEVTAAEGGLEDGWVRLFDGATLDGWVRRGGEARFEIRDGELVGLTVVGQPNSFLCTASDYSDFELELEFRVDDPRVNSGVQVRSQSLPEYQNGRVHGYQIEIDPSDRGWTGGIYDEGRRGWLQDLKNNPQARAAFVLGQWNRLRVRCHGDRIQSWVNGIATADLVDSVTSTGFIGLQVHATRLSDPMEVRWRNIRLRPIDSDVP